MDTFFKHEVLACTFLMSAVEGIRPTALRVKAQRLAAELSTSVFQRFLFLLLL